MINWNSVLAVTLATFFANIIRAYYARYRARLAARTEIPYSKNWRGQYVPDLWRKRAERGIVIAWVLFTIWAFVFSYFMLTY